MSKFSIITVNYNDAVGLQKTVQSVIKQTFKDFEYIVIDGASADGSVHVIEEHSAHINHWLSEKDSGVYAAMNKGIRLAQGDYVLFLNSGDYFVDDHVLERVALKVYEVKAIYYGNLLFRTSEKEFLREYPDTLTFQYFLDRSLPHPGSFIKKSLFEELFYYSEDFRISSDWEFFIYAICKAEVSYQHLNETISVFNLQGMSNQPENKQVIENERLQVYKKHFQPFYEQALKCRDDEALLNNKSMRLLVKLNQNPKGKKWASRMLRLVSYFSIKN